MRTTFLVLAVASAACLHPQPTQAVIAQLSKSGDKPSFRGCTVSLAWTLQDLIDNCGEPDLGYVAWANRPGSLCALYRTSARSFAAGMGADAVAVCMTKAEALTESAKNAARVRVREVFGLNANDLSKLGR